MADESIQTTDDGMTDDDSRKALVRERLASTRITLAPVEGPVDLARAKRVPIGQIASVVTAFA